MEARLASSPPVQGPPPSPHVTHYTIIDLPPLPGGTASQAQGLNTAGDVVGYSVADSRAHAVIGKDGVTEDLGILDSFASGVNASDQVVGYFYPGSTPHALLWSEQDGPIDLGTLPGFDSSIATGINDAGLVVGMSFMQSDPNTQQGFEWTAAGGMQPLPGAVSALAVNRSGQVAGIDAALHAALFRNGQTTDLGTIAETSVAGALNSSGRAAGASGTHAFVFDGTMHDLGLRDNWTSASATGINDAGIVVGSGMSPVQGSARVVAPAAEGKVAIHEAIGGVGHPFIWTKAASLIDLNTLISTDSGWALVVAMAINTKGQIVVLGNRGGALHAVLLDLN